MRSRKGFTLIELMIVVVIVGVLAAIIVPLLLSRVEKAKYSEGKAIAGQIATAIRAYVAEYGAPATGTLVLTTDLGFKTNELDGQHFLQTSMTVTGVTLVPASGLLSYTITLPPRDPTKLTAGNLVLTCTLNNTVFTPTGI